MDEPNGYTMYADIPESLRNVQQSLDSFVAINYETALGMLTGRNVAPEEIIHYRGKIFDIIRNNPPLESVPKYYEDGREDYLWYSDFYDDISKDTYHTYRAFIKPTDEITPTNYAEELAKIDLPYFRELVDLVSLERLRIKYEPLLSAKETDKGKEETEVWFDMELEEEAVDLYFLGEEQYIDEENKTKDRTIESIPESVSVIDETEENKEEPQAEDPVVTEQEQNTQPTTQTEPKAERLPAKRSYEPKLNNEQYKLLAEYIEKIRLFRRPVKAAQLRKLLSGKLPEALQVTNQKSLVYLFDELSDKGYIKGTWMSVAAGNKDFISFRSEGNIRRYGSEIHYIPIGQMMNDRKRSKREFVQGLDDIDELIELIEENREE